MATGYKRARKFEHATSCLTDHYKNNKYQQYLKYQFLGLSILQVHLHGKWLHPQLLSLFTVIRLHNEQGKERIQKPSTAHCRYPSSLGNKARLNESVSVQSMHELISRSS